jgi:hypothetical protein
MRERLEYLIEEIDNIERNILSLLKSKDLLIEEKKNIEKKIKEHNDITDRMSKAFNETGIKQSIDDFKFMINDLSIDGIYYFSAMVSYQNPDPKIYKIDKDKLLQDEVLVFKIVEKIANTLRFGISAKGKAKGNAFKRIHEKIFLFKDEILKYEISESI